jgi:hypothetical protein
MQSYNLLLLFLKTLLMQKTDFHHLAGRQTRRWRIWVGAVGLRMIKRIPAAAKKFLMGIKGECFDMVI